MKFEGFLTFGDQIDSQEFIEWFLINVPRILPQAEVRRRGAYSVIVDNEGTHQEFVLFSLGEWAEKYFIDMLAVHERYAQRPQRSMYIVYFYPDSSTMNILLYHLAKRWHFVWSLLDIVRSSEEFQREMETRWAKTALESHKTGHDRIEGYSSSEGFLTFRERFNSDDLHTWFTVMIPQILPNTQIQFWPGNGISFESEREYDEFKPVKKSKHTAVVAIHEQHDHYPQFALHKVRFYPHPFVPIFATALYVILYHLAERWRFVWSFDSVPISSDELRTVLERYWSKK